MSVGGRRLILALVGFKNAKPLPYHLMYVPQGECEVVCVLFLQWCHATLATHPVSVNWQPNHWQAGRDAAQSWTSSMPVNTTGNSTIHRMCVYWHVVRVCLTVSL